MKISYCWLESSHFWYLQIRVSYFFHYPIDDIHMICRIPKIVIMRLYHISYLDDGLYHIDVYNYYISYEHSLDHWTWEVHLSNVMYWCILYIIYIYVHIYSIVQWHICIYMLHVIMEDLPQHLLSKITQLWQVSELPGPEGWAHGPSANDQAAHGQNLGGCRWQKGEPKRGLWCDYNDIMTIVDCI